MRVNARADLAMNGLQELRFAKADALAAKRGRRLERVSRPGSSCENRQGASPPIRAAKKEARTTKPQILRKNLRRASQSFVGLLNPVTLFLT
ncbi:hypothetical protein GmRootV15_56420 [Variovorax sp. V15]